MKTRNQLCLNPTHAVNGTDMFASYPQGFEAMSVGMGCFWGAERFFWSLPGVHTTSVGYQGGPHISPDYRLVCSGSTGHAEVVQIVYDPAVISFEALLKVFFENHNPTQGDRQGNDRGSQYRSAVYTYSDAQTAQALAAKDMYDAAYKAKGFGAITTEIKPAGTYFPAEDYHQQYLAKNPGGYCNHGPTGISCPIGLAKA